MKLYLQCFIIFLFSISSHIVLALEKSSPKIFSLQFGSCVDPSEPIKIFDAINREKPDVFVLLGDNVYGDTEDMEVLAAKYQELGSQPGYKKLKEQSQVVAIWDDHDFGGDNVGKEYPMKNESRKIMLDFFEEPESSQRRTRESGIYTSYWFEAAGLKIHLILPDLRWNRDEINHSGYLSYVFYRQWKNIGHFDVSEDPDASMLGEEQWQWLESELKKPADLKIIGSSLQVIADFTGWEAWANYPADRKRLFSFIKNEKIDGVILLSGDTHWGELSRYRESMPYDLWDITSSGLSKEWKDVSPNKHRVGEPWANVNYGFIDLYREPDKIKIHFGLRDIDGREILSKKINLDSLSNP